MSSHDEEQLLDDFLEHYALDTIYSDMTVEEFFEHHGVKGMKWGVRKDTRGQGLTAWMIKDGASKAEMNGLKRAVARTHGQARAGVRTLNGKYRGVNLRTDAKARKKYNSEINQIFKRSYPRGLELFGAYSVTNAAVVLAPAVGLPASIGLTVVRNKQWRNERAAVLAQSDVLAPADGFTITFNFVLDENGLIVDVVPDDPSVIEHSAEMTSEEFLAHYGVLGMHWGKRKGDSGGSDATSSVSEDHVNVAALRKKKISQLSNAEMKAVTERMNLEKKYREMNPSDHEILMRKLKKHTDTAGKILLWMATPSGKALLKGMGLDEKSRKNADKAKQAADIEKRKEQLKAKAEKKKVKAEAKAADNAKNHKKEYIGPDGGVVYK